LRKLENILFINCWKAAEVLIRLKDIIAYSKDL